MGDKKKLKKKCCGKFKKKGKHCSSCPITGSGEKCSPDKEYCKGCDIPGKGRKPEDKKKKKSTTKKKK